MVIAVGACYPVWLRRLQQAGIVSAGFELDLMLEEGFAISKAQRLAHPERRAGLSGGKRESRFNICWDGGNFTAVVSP